MKVGILTLFHGNDNWGGVLQGYALKTVLESRFHDIKADIINYRSGMNIVYPSTKQQMSQYSVGEIFNKAVEKVDKKIYRNKMNSILSDRRMLFKNFTTSISDGKVVYTDASFKELEEEYDCLICGSDQIWNPNVARPGYFLKGISDSCRKISYAASIARDNLSEHEREVMIPLIGRFDYISVREKTAAKFLQSYIGLEKEVYEVLDPALMLRAEEWESLIEDRERDESKYALAFFFSDSLGYRKQILEYCKNLGLNLKFIPYAQNKYIKNDEIGECERLYDVGPKEFLQLFRDAEYVFTDSFHGCVFSILFHKQFVVFERDKNGKTSKNSRLYDLLDKFDLSDRLVKNPDFSAIINKQIDFCVLDKLLESYREHSFGFLTEALCGVTEKNITVKRVDGLKKRECTGCGQCQVVCPKQCICLKRDEEGFVYPTVNTKICIDCGLCIKKCTAQRDSRTSEKFNTYIGYNTDDGIRLQSSSGGLFGAIAYNFLEMGGVVYGAAFNSDFSVEHVRIGSLEDLPQLFGSKYVQSNMEAAYGMVENDLRDGKAVLFSGTPCQVASMQMYIHDKQLAQNLYLIDFICHGVPSPAIWESYLQYANSEKTLDRISFRDKSHGGWHDYCLYIEYKDNSQMVESHETNAFMRSFLNEKNIRPSCYRCKFKAENYASDITLGDAWKIEKECMEWADDKGTSLFVVRTEKGDVMLKQLPSSFLYCQSDYKKWCGMNPAIISSTIMPSSRERFFDDFLNKDYREFWAHERKIPTKYKLKYVVKRWSRIIGIEKYLRKHI